VYRPEQLSAAIAAMLKTVPVVSVKADSSRRIFSPPLIVLLQSYHGTIRASRYGGRLQMLQMAAVFAELERGMIRERVMAGLERAKAQGVTLGADAHAGYTLLDKLAPQAIKSHSLSMQARVRRNIRSEARRRGAVGCTNSATELFEMVVSALQRGQRRKSRISQHPVHQVFSNQPKSGDLRV
jgi:DNA invertase Pin-like site-specific DNA recombinase